MKGATLECKNCGIEYIQKSNGQKYCTRSCRNSMKIKLAYTNSERINTWMAELTRDEEFRDLVICMGK